MDHITAFHSLRSCFDARQTAFVGGLIVDEAFCHERRNDHPGMRALHNPPVQAIAQASTSHN